MVQLLSNLIKLTEYPFAYSFIGLILAMSGHRINIESPDLSTLGPIITLVGIFATVLSITDPFGNFLKFLLRRLGTGPIGRIHLPGLGPEEIMARASLTNWISFEIDKIVSTIYFLIILIFILLALNTPGIKHSWH